VCVCLSGVRHTC